MSGAEEGKARHADLPLTLPAVTETAGLPGRSSYLMNSISEYFGSGRMKLDDEIVELKAWDAVRVSPGTWRGYEAGPNGLEILVIGAPNLGDAPREDVEGERDWWS